MLFLLINKSFDHKMSRLLVDLFFLCTQIILILPCQEVRRIKNEHPDDKQCIVNDRVKGRLKVTRAFGAGFLKQVCSW